MLRLAREKGEVRVVNDQFGGPTYARDLAQALLTVIPACSQQKGVHRYHFANCGITTWYEFACAIFEITGVPCVVHPVTTAEYPTPTRRPKYSVLDTQKFSQTFHYPIPCWKQSLADCLKML
jgi:dTDP-4-dehydrorhamnose reductase